ncbi:transient receptor potential cation channel protein painless-like [Periplaneta americana]|uniref:transient receptor potential cation channel protein painless-like n=1 Tax=Periplaneta americana TaxID=6978 RepID=UPI0037E7D3FB
MPYEVDLQPTVAVSPVQHQAELLAALQARDIDSFSQLLQASSTNTDSSCLEAACRQADGTPFVSLLLQHGTDPNTVNPVLLETPLHITAELGNSETLEVLLSDARVDVNVLNGSEQTALHVAVKKSGEVDEKERGAFRHCISLLLEWSANNHEGTLYSINVNASDWLGNTALHYAAQNGDQDITLCLLNHGAYLGARNHAGMMPVSGIESHTLKNFLDSCLKMPRDDAVLFKYDFLVPPVDLKSVVHDETDAVMMKLHTPSPEMDPLIHISLSSKLQNLLLHPVLSSFIHLKWQHTRKFYYYDLSFYVVLVSILTFTILQQYMTPYHERSSLCTKLSTKCFFKIAIHVLLGLCILCLLMKLLFHLSLSPVRYLRTWRSYLQILLTFLAAVILFKGWIAEDSILDTVTLLLAWTWLLLFTGKHPAMYLHFHLFKKVCCSFLKYMIWCLLLIIAFTLSFYTLFHNKKTYIPERSTFVKFFQNPLVSLFTTIVMLLGGYDTKLLPLESASVASHFIVILFLFLLSLVFLNILTGLAVSLTLNIQSQVEMVHLIARVDVTSDIERLLLGNPLHIHLRMRQLYLNRTPLLKWIIRSSMYLWLLCNWLRCFKNLHRSVILFPNSGFDHANILFPFGSNSKVSCNYNIDCGILKIAASIAQNDSGANRQLESLDERLSNIEKYLRRTEVLQQDILQLLQRVTPSFAHDERSIVS